MHSSQVKMIVLALVVFFSTGSFKGQSSTFTVSSFNLRLDTSNDKQNAWPFRKEMVKELISYHNFDIIGTQEGFLHQIQDVLELEGWAYYGKGRDDGKTQGEHSAILYKKDKFELLDSGDFWLREEPELPGKGWDATCCNRIASWVKLQDKVTNQSFFVFNVHFDHEGVIARKESGKLMVKKMQQIAKNAPVILTGDFNSTPDTEQIRHISSFLDDSYKVSKTPPYGPVGTFSGFNLNAELKNRIDYVFVSSDFKVHSYGALTDIQQGRFPSDHLPVVVKLTLK